ncbi:hypothetical protein ABZV81_29565 [Streptomyces parvus]|uniref:hypothetical protein n=1 Tax=Streptomyces parvus TaxID=66428 RepID=UPI0033BCE4B2
MTFNQSPPARGAATTVLDRHAESGPATAAAGGYGGWEDEDNQRGFERDETDQLHQVVRRLTDDGDRRARATGRHARRTYAEMAPGQTRQPVLYMTRPLTFTPSAPGLERQPVLRMMDRLLRFAPTSSKAGADDACVLCGSWLCGGNCFAPAPTPSLHRPTGVTALTDQEREDLSKKVGEANKRSESRPK